MDENITFEIKIGAIRTEKDAIKALLKLCITSGAVLLSKREEIGESFQRLAHHIAGPFLTKEELDEVIESITNEWKTTCKTSPIPPSDSTKVN